MGNSTAIRQSLPKGTIVSSIREKYRVEEMIGSGGFGITYKVVRLSDGLIFAMKEFFPSTLCQRDSDSTLSYLKTNAKTFGEGVDNFITEAERLSNLNISHSNIISVTEVFKSNNTAYYVMDYIDGVNLRQYIKKQHNKPLTQEQMLSVMRPVLHAISLLHKNRLTHLDIKHENIVLTVESDGSLRPVVIDFGQSKHYDRKGNATSTLTNAGCSDGFSPQEQYLGLDKFTPQADIYALCATMFYLLTAKHPPKSSDITTSYIENALPSEVSLSVRQALVNGLRKDKDDRTDSVEKLANELGLDITSQSEDGSVTRLLNIRRHKDFDFKKIIKPLVGTAVIIAVVSGGYFWYANSPRHIPTDSEILTEAINKRDLSVLKQYAEADSIRAFLPYSELLIQQKDYTEGIKYAKMALITKDSIAARELVATAERLSAKPEVPVEEIVAENPADSNDETLPPIDANEERFLRAKRENNFNELLSLAKANYIKAYFPVALAYYKQSKNNEARRWAEKAVNAKLNVTEAQHLLNDIKSKEKAVSNAEMVRNAKTIAELRSLANSGILEAYAPLSKMEYDETNYDNAKRYAELAQKHGVATAESRKVLSLLEAELY